MRPGIFIILCMFFIFTACSSNSMEIDSETSKLDTQTEEKIIEETKESEETDKDDAQVTEKKEENGKEDEKGPLFQIKETNWTVHPQEETDDKYVLITIDDAPDTYSVEMAEFLAEENVPAIFFVNGHFLQDEEGKNQLKTIHDLGFEIGNHTMNHVNLRDITEEEIVTEIKTLNQLIEEITGESPTFFRAPFGINTEKSKEVLKEENMIWMNWTYGYDWEQGYMEKEALADIMLNTEYLTNGANLLMHDREWTNAALPEIIEGFRDKGYKFIPPGAIHQ